jgi:hypothetical protein
MNRGTGQQSGEIDDGIDGKQNMIELFNCIRVETCTLKI